MALVLLIKAHRNLPKKAFAPLYIIKQLPKPNIQQGSNIQTHEGLAQTGNQRVNAEGTAQQALKKLTEGLGLSVFRVNS